MAQDVLRLAFDSRSSAVTIFSGMMQLLLCGQ